MTEKYCNLEDAALDALMRERLSPHRYIHSLAVAKRARELAERAGEDGDRAYFAGLIHDICKCEPKETLLQTALSGDIIPDEKERSTPSVLHQFAGAVFAQRELGVADRDIINAVRWHCTGRTDMSALEQIVYLADLSGEDRDFPDIERTRRETDRGLAEGMAYCTAKVREHLLRRGFTMCPNEEACYRQYGKVSPTDLI